MELHVEKLDHTTVLSLSGKLNANSAYTVQDQVLELAHQPGCCILLDMSGVTYLSSAGLRMLLLLYRSVQDHNGQMALAGMTEEVTDIMDITGFLDLFTTFEDRQQGIEALRKVG